MRYEVINYPLYHAVIDHKFNRRVVFESRSLTVCRSRARIMNQGGHMSRAIVIHICKDGTISYRTLNEKVFNGVALPVFSVDTVEQAQAIQVLFGRRQYVEHPQIPGRPWYRWTDFPGELDALDGITERLAQWWKREEEAGRA